ncbi:MAG: threonine aldolase, partial [Bacteroidetes bacterium]|nr:threonine aldolase [Bacteroidota bacterium]
RAKDLEKILERLPYVSSVLPVDTNIVIFDLSSSITSLEFLGKLEQAGIKAVPFGKHTVRFVTHLEFDDHQLAQCEDIFKKLIL